MNRKVLHRSPWTDLPQELLAMIADHLDPFCHPQFRAVCKNWRSSILPPFIRLSPFLPLKVNLGYGSSHTLVSTTVYLVRPRHDIASVTPRNRWLMAVEQFSPGKLRLVHPLTGTTASPHEIPKESFAKKLSTLDALEISKGFSLREPNGTNPYPKDIYTKNCTKVVLWPNTLSKSPGINDCKVVMLRGGEFLTCTSLRDNVSEFIQSSGIFIDDIIYWKGMIWVVDNRGRLYVVNFKANLLNIVTSNAFKHSNVGARRLLEFDGELYMVAMRSTYLQCRRFMVYKLQEQLHSWVNVNCLGNKVMFFCSDTCFFARATDVPGFPSNCIVFPVRSKYIGLYTKGAFTKLSIDRKFSNFFWGTSIQEVTST